MPRLLLALAILALQAPSARLAWVPNPRVANGTWVADPSHHLHDTTVARLNGELGALERETGVEVAVAIVDSTSGLEPVDAALELHRAWGVGKRGTDNGILLLWVPPQRAVHISVGYGLEGVLPDARAGRIRDQLIFPAFKRNAFDRGVLDGVRALAAAAREEPGVGRRAEGAPALVERDRAGRRDGGPPGWLLGLFGAVGAAGAAAAGGLWYRRSRPRACPNGHGPMRRLSEQEDDRYLDEGQRLEERLGSIDYDVWACPQCDQTLVVPRRKLFSSYKECPTCKRRTVEARRRTLRAATTSMHGTEHVTERCKSCGWTREYERSLPRLSESSGRSASSGGGGGGGGSSFGGGSAGGGGAGGRY